MPMPPLGCYHTPLPCDNVQGQQMVRASAIDRGGLPFLGQSWKCFWWGCSLRQLLLVCLGGSEFAKQWV